MARVAIYVRVSTDGQTTANQELELRAWAERAGHVVVEVYADNGHSGSKSRRDRPALDAALKDAVRRRFDVLAAWSVDRLGRSLQDLVGTLQDLRGAGVDLFLHQQALDTATPSGRAMYGMLGVFAEFERAMIVERVKAGLARARAQGKRLGRPRVAAKTEAAIRQLRAQGIGIRAIAKRAGCGVGTVQRVVGDQRSSASNGAVGIDPARPLRSP
jgi:DNA invertase Pin-like site-specific DNA recombinase